MTKDEIEQHALEIEKWVAKKVHNNLTLEYNVNNVISLAKLSNDPVLGKDHEICVVRRTCPVSLTTLVYRDGTYDKYGAMAYDHIEDTTLGFKVHLIRDWAIVKRQVLDTITHLIHDEFVEKVDATETMKYKDLEKRMCDMATDFRL